MGGELLTSESKGRRLRRPSFGAAIAVVAVVALGGIGYAAIPSQGGTFRACYAKTEGILLGIPHSKGDVRLVNEGEPCRSYETLTTWNQTGPQGPPGLSGVVGKASNSFNSNQTPSNAAAWVFVGNPATVTLAAGDFVFYTGDTSAYVDHAPSPGFAEFSLCFDPGTGVLQTSTQPTRVTMDGSFGGPFVVTPVSMSGWDAPPPGTYKVGLCVSSADGISVFRSNNRALVMRGG